MTIKPHTVITARCITDSNLIFTAYVIDRKNDMLTLQVDGQIIRKKVKRGYDGSEYVMALGSYSMAPVFK